MFNLSWAATPANLRRVLWVDALTGAASAGLQLGWSETQGALLGLTPAFLQESALLLLLYVGLATWLAIRAKPPRAALALLIVGNFAWSLICLGFALYGPATLTPVGRANFLLQALFVFGLAILQRQGWRAQPSSC